MNGLMHKHCPTIPLPSSADILGKHEHSQIEVSYSVFESLSSQSISGLHPVYNVSMTRVLVYSNRRRFSVARIWLSRWRSRSVQCLIDYSISQFTYGFTLHSKKHDVLRISICDIDLLVQNIADGYLKLW